MKFKILFVAAGLFAFTISSSLANWSPVRPTARKAVAEENLRNFASELGGEYSPVSCVSSDSGQGDGYVSCVLLHNTGTIETEKAAFCRYQTGILADKGCKFPSLDNLVN